LEQGPDGLRYEHIAIGYKNPSMLRISLANLRQMAS
jgi:hypothetical protein